MGIDEMIFFCVLVQSMRWLTMEKKAIYVEKLTAKNGQRAQIMLLLAASIDSGPLQIVMQFRK